MSHQKFVARVEEFVAKANTAFNATLTVPVIRTDIRGKTAGYAIRKYGKWLLRFNPEMAEKYGEEAILTTAAHETAHYVANSLFNKNCNHGYEWKKVMRVFGIEPDRCHTYDLTAARSPKARATFSYKCACRQHEVSSILARRMFMGRSYTCKNCHSKLTKV